MQNHDDLQQYQDALEQMSDTTEFQKRFAIYKLHQSGPWRMYQFNNADWREEIEIDVHQRESLGCVTFISGEIKLLGFSVTYLKIVGSLSFNGNLSFRRKLQSIYDLGVKHLVIDFDQVTYMNSTTIGMLVRFTEIFRDSEGEMSLTKIPPKVIALFEMLDLTFNIYDHLEEAIANLILPNDAY